MGCFREFTTGLAKYIIFFFNLLILICAVTLIGLGVWYKSVNNSGLDMMSISSYTIAVGVLIALIAFFGCCGAIKESSCMLTTYAAILLTLFVIQVVLAILAFVAIKNGDNELESEVNKTLSHLYEDRNTKDTLDVINAFQNSFECCGLYGPQGSEVLINGQILPSCCSKDATTCSLSEARSTGCVSKFTDFFESSIKIIGIIAIVFAVVELLCALFAFYIRNDIRKQGQYV